jgi:hypothetical protein
MAIRKTRSQMVMSSAEIAAVYADWGKEEVVSQAEPLTETTFLPLGYVEVRVAEGCYAWEIVDEAGRKAIKGLWNPKFGAIAVARLIAEKRGVALIVNR